ncbi:MAG: 4-hydroxy-tetrahydrodipicolinate reductase, partial [Gammaproteobacteria bacterium]|nr:4-hydroxy-tetrahydrodipicolinate reductase [Gammaproteobacteria bacterium]
MSLRVAVLGAGGRMGQALINAIEAQDDDGITLVGALVRAGSAAVGKAAGPEASYTDQPVSALDNAE